MFETCWETVGLGLALREEWVPTCPSIRVYFLLSLLVGLFQYKCSFLLILISYIVSLTALISKPKSLISIPLQGQIELHS